MGDMTDLKQNFDAVKFANSTNGHCIMNGGQNSNFNVPHNAFQSPYAMTSMADPSQRFQTLSSTSPMKYAAGQQQYMQHHMGSEIYATVKRTPRPRRDDVHIYQYPRMVSKLYSPEKRYPSS